MKRYGWNEYEAAKHMIVRCIAEALVEDLGLPQSVEEIEANMHEGLARTPTPADDIQE